MNRTLVIADPGCTHEGDLNALLALVDLAATCGADVFKAQWVSDADALARRRDAADYAPYYRWLQFPSGWHGDLAARCRASGIRYACTVYLPEDVAIIEGLSSLYKVSAFEAGADDLIAAYADAMTRHDGTRLVVSLGLGFSRGDVEARIPSTLRDRVDYLHCVSSYPTPSDALNLGRIAADGLDGFSDHSNPSDTATGALAVAAGARIVERHICLESCSPSNPDYVVSMSAHGFYFYVAGIRTAEATRGPVAPSPALTERPMLRHRAKGR